jgi:O-antigen biosynthesis protein WbqP
MGYVKWRSGISISILLLNTESLFLMLRFFDIIFSILGLLFGAPILAVLCLVCWFDTRSPFFRQERVGYYLKPFVLVKFRTMRHSTASVATHLVEASAVTPFGSFLRQKKLDELPQLWNVLQGDMSLVGPRPCLFNQVELIAKRAALGVYDVKPGITGLAQIRGVDMSSPELLAKTDAEMLKDLNIFNYFRYIFLTILGGGAGDRVREES